jgi:hypothetical protein
MRSTEVAGNDLQPASRRTVIVARVERDDERRIGPLVHAQHEVLNDRRAGERHPFFRDTSQDNARIGSGVDMVEVGDARGQLNVAVHRKIEQGLLGIEMTQNRRGRDVQLSRDIGERRRREALLREDFACSLEDLLTMDEWRPAHL